MKTLITFVFLFGLIACGGREKIHVNEEAIEGAPGRSPVIPPENPVLDEEMANQGELIETSSADAGNTSLNSGDNGNSPTERTDEEIDGEPEEEPNEEPVADIGQTPAAGQVASIAGGQLPPLSASWTNPVSGSLSSSQLNAVVASFSGSGAPAGGGAAGSQAPPEVCEELHGVELRYEVLSGNIVRQDATGVIANPGISLRFSIYAKVGSGEALWTLGRGAFDYVWKKDGQVISNPLETQYSSLFNDPGNHTVEVTVSDRCRNQNTLLHRNIVFIQENSPIQAEFHTGSGSPPIIPVSDEIPDWAPFALGRGEAMAVAMNNYHAVIVKADGTGLSYKFYDLQEKKPLTPRWVALAGPAGLRCEGSGLRFDQPSVAINSNSSRVMIAFMKTCAGKKNVHWVRLQLAVGQTVLVEEVLGNMGQSGQKWAPVAMVNTANDFAVAWIRERKIDLPDQDPDFRHADADTQRILKRVYMKIFPAAGGNLDVMDVLPAEQAPHRYPYEYNEFTITRVWDSHLQGSSFGTSFCFSFRRKYADNFGHHVSSDKEEVICKSTGNGTILRRSQGFAVAPPALASVRVGSGDKLIAVDPDGSLELKVDVWKEDGSRQRYFLQGDGGVPWSSPIYSLSASNVYGLIHVTLQNVDSTKTLVTHLPNQNSSFLGVVREVPLGESPAHSIRQAANSQRQTMTLWSDPVSGFYGVLGTIEP
ncbi:MAG: hypothetical protein Q7T11_02025 [Deltaproteobacteria bacterium]|nr:hypothetical protein [Deltaproteobacteria bacterium]